ncbi:uncharacterized protein ACO6RY_13016 [Pungitius sinensis]
MAQRKTPKAQARKEGKTAVESKNGKRPERGGGGEGEGGGGGTKYSMFTWFVVLALLGVWSSVAVIYFEVVDYDSVIGKLTAYDTDGDGDFDVEDAKVLLGLTKDGGGNAESLEEVLNILAEEGSDWIYGFFTFLYDVVSSPVERGEGEEGEEATAQAQEEVEEEGGQTPSDAEEVKGVALDLQNLEAGEPGR